MTRPLTDRVWFPLQLAVVLALALCLEATLTTSPGPDDGPQAPVLGVAIDADNSATSAPELDGAADRSVVVELTPASPRRSTAESTTSDWSALGPLTVAPKTSPPLAA